MVSMNDNVLSVEPLREASSRHMINQTVFDCNKNNNNNSVFNSNKCNFNSNCADLRTWNPLQQDPLKMGKLKDMVERTASSANRNVVDSLLHEINQLSDVEKLLLYLKLPVGHITENDPLKQSLNPLGSRSEIQLTITWMKTHLEEDLEISLPKEEVYKEYLHFSNKNGFKALSTADFGKVMKQVFPSVRARRLGHRGASKYCHSGLKKKYVLEVPSLPELSQTNNECHSSCGIMNKLFGLDIPEEESQKNSLNVVMEWAEKFCNSKFDTFVELALFLIKQNYVSSKSKPAYSLLSSKPDQDKCENTQQIDYDLQKLHEREQKRKLQEHQPTLSSKSSPERPKTRKRSGTLTKTLPDNSSSNRTNNKASKTFNGRDCVGVKSEAMKDVQIGSSGPLSDVVASDKLSEVTASKDLDFDQISTFIKRENDNESLEHNWCPSSDKLFSNDSLIAPFCSNSSINHILGSDSFLSDKYGESAFNESQGNVSKYVPIQPKVSQFSNKEIVCERNKFNSKKLSNWNEIISNESNKLKDTDNIGDQGNDNFISLSISEPDDIKKSNQLTELRKLLQENLPSGSGTSATTTSTAVSSGVRGPTGVTQDGELSATNRRRVSFQPSIDASEEATLNLLSPHDSQVSSPGHSKVCFDGIYNVNTLSMSSNHGLSQQSSTNASPFISPANTPLDRSRHNSGQSGSTYLTPIRASSHQSDRFPMNAFSENSSPFMSPAPTPVFPRSRHNSSQNLRNNPYSSISRPGHNSGASSFRHLPYSDDFIGRRGGKIRGRHLSGGIPPSPQSAPVSPLIHDSNRCFSEAPLFQQYRGCGSIQNTSIKQNAARVSSEDDCRKRHMSDGTTIHYYPSPNFNLNISSNFCSDPLEQEISNVMDKPDTGSNLLPCYTNRPQSVPLPQMQPTSYSNDLYCMVKSHPNTPLINQTQQFHFGPECSFAQNSAQSSYAPTPVPSEYNDFCDYTGFELDSVLAVDSNVVASKLESVDSFPNLSGNPDDMTASGSDSFSAFENFSESTENGSRGGHGDRVVNTLNSEGYKISKEDISVSKTDTISLKTLNPESEIEQPSSMYNSTARLALNSTPPVCSLNMVEASLTPSTPLNVDIFKGDFERDPNAFNALVFSEDRT